MNDQEKWTGGCLCGGCRYQFQGDRPHSGYCHCDMCKRATGGPFAVLVQARLSDLVWTTGKPSVYRSSPIATRGFCASCGTPLFLRYDGDELIRLTAGSLDHPERIRPAGHYGIESRLRWAECGPGLPEEETQERF
ncbi:GFA family protein [Rhizobium sp. SEMIA 4085]|uniref:GFA family glutathione-dependent formaldehyde-activating protein n=2 Tax=Rhizobium TaxID=379 RepID=A0A0B4XFP4_9HYPH|nr:MULTISPECIES: GFA family protein [Rhizobium]AJD45916.1 GFA family glutathione-dependent formaldehyde-activating protein [Rhizobium gallicum bv. gallicum R602sp]NNH32063.1 GFA family protein [Rhizobium sp. SEMIA 4085]